MKGFGKKSIEKNDDQDEYVRLSKQYRSIKKRVNSAIHEVNRMDGKEPEIDWTKHDQEVEEYYENNPLEEYEETYQDSLSEFLSSRGDGHEHEYVGDGDD